MNFNFIDVFVIAAYFIVLMGVGFWHGRGSRDSSDHYFKAKGLLPWWAIGAAYVATGMNTDFPPFIHDGIQGYHQLRVRIFCLIVVSSVEGMAGLR